MASSKTRKRVVAEELIEKCDYLSRYADRDPAVAKSSKRRRLGSSKTEPVSLGSCLRCSHRDWSWCQHAVTVHEVDWYAALEEVDSLPVDPTACSSWNKFPSGICISIVSCDSELQAALAALRQSMKDQVLAIDLEWRPDFSKGSCSKVALVQLASSQHAVLVRTCQLTVQGKHMLTAFLRRPDLVLLGLGWDGADERKMRSSFGMGKADFTSFIDLSCLVRSLGYFQTGLANMSQHILGFCIQKSKKLTMSNWEVPVLSALQIRYAAFDVLIAGAVFRGLRFWHDKALPCSICSYAMGTAVQPQDFACSCGARFSDARRFGDHALSKGHTQAGKQCQRCSGCARYVMLPSQTKVEAPPPVLG